MERAESNKDVSLVPYRPLSIGEIIDISITLYKRYFGTFLYLFFLYSLAVAALGILSQVLGVYIQGQLLSLADVAKEQSFTTSAVYYLFSAVLFGTVGMFLIQVASIYLFATVLAAVSVVVGSIVEDSKAMDGIEVLKQTLHISKRILLTVAVSIGAIYTAAGAGVVSTIGLIIAAVVVGTTDAIMFVMFLASLLFSFGLVLVLAKVALSPTVSAIENLSPIASVMRSAELITSPEQEGTKNHPVVRISVLLTAISALWISLGMVVIIPKSVLMYIYYFKNISDPSNWSAAYQPMPFVYELFLTAGGVIYTSLVMPLVMIPIVLFYYDTRSRREGFDLWKRLENL